MLISEVYCSRQGEGLYTGTSSIFLRTSGCNLRCGFCDTPFASWHPEGGSLSVDEIVERVQMLAEHGQHVVITGGEPMLPREITVLCRELSGLGHPITVETAGTIYRELDCELMSISPKLSNSDPEPGRAGQWYRKHQAARYRPDTVRQLMEQYNYQLKFVVERPEDLPEIREYLERVQPYDASRVMLMPEGVEVAELDQRRQWLKPMCEQAGFTYCPRQQIYWYGNRRGT